MTRILNSGRDEFLEEMNCRFCCGQCLVIYSDVVWREKQMCLKMVTISGIRVLWRHDRHSGTIEFNVNIYNRSIFCGVDKQSGTIEKLESHGAHIFCRTHRIKNVNINNVFIWCWKVYRHHTNPDSDVDTDRQPREI